MARLNTNLSEEERREPEWFNRPRKPTREENNAVAPPSELEHQSRARPKQVELSEDECRRRILKMFLEDEEVEELEDYENRKEKRSPESSPVKPKTGSAINLNSEPSESELDANNLTTEAKKRPSLAASNAKTVRRRNIRTKYEVNFWESSDEEREDERAANLRREQGKLEGESKDENFFQEEEDLGGSQRDGEEEEAEKEEEDIEVNEYDMDSFIVSDGEVEYESDIEDGYLDDEDNSNVDNNEEGMNSKELCGKTLSVSQITKVKKNKIGWLGENRTLRKVFTEISEDEDWGDDGASDGNSNKDAARRQLLTHPAETPKKFITNKANGRKKSEVILIDSDSDSSKDEDFICHLVELSDSEGKNSKDAFSKAEENFCTLPGRYEEVIGKIKYLNLDNDNVKLSTKTSTPIKSKLKRNLPLVLNKESKYTKEQFTYQRQKLAERFLVLIDTLLASNEISSRCSVSGGIHLNWSKTLRNTAGTSRTWEINPLTGKPWPLSKPHPISPHLKFNSRTYTFGPVSPHDNRQFHAEINLAIKVCSTPFRLYSTLAHEYCHVVNTIFDGESGHGKNFHMRLAKARKLLLPFGYDIQLGTCHQYVIEYKYEWKCTSEKLGDPPKTICGAVFGRHSKSIDIERKLCGKCHSRLVMVKPYMEGKIPIHILNGTKNGNNGLELKRQNEYQVFMKRSLGNGEGSLRGEFPGLSQKELMKKAAERWRETKTRGNPVILDLTS